MKALKPFPAVGQSWEVTANGIVLIQALALADSPMEVGTKFVISECVSRYGGSWWKVLVWGHEGYLSSDRIICGCKLLGDP